MFTGQLQGVGHLQAELGLVALVGIAAVAVLHIGRRAGLGPGEHVLAVGILGVEQAQDVLFDLADFTGDRGPVGVAEATVTGLDGQFLCPLQGRGDAVEHAFFLSQRVGHAGHVAAVLGQQGALLLQLQQLGGADRIVAGTLDSIAGADLRLGLGGVREILGIAGRAGLEILRSGNSHGRLFLKER